MYRHLYYFLLKNKSKIYNVCIVSFILLAIVYVEFENSLFNLKILAPSYILILISIINLISSKSKPYSLNNMVYLFFILFIGSSAILQYKAGVFFMNENSKLNADNFFFGNLIFLLIILLYTIVYKFQIRKIYKVKQHKNYNIRVIFNKKIIIGFTIIITLFICLYFYPHLEIIFSRYALGEKVSHFNKYIFAIVNTFRSVPLIVFLFFKLNKGKDLKYEIVLILLIILLNFPTAIPRFKVALTYIPLLLIYGKPIINKYVFNSLFLMNFFIIFPFLHQFRKSKSYISLSDINLSMLTSPHFDTFQNTVNLFTHNIITGGQQLVGVIFFFIPRSIWADKPVGSGHVLAKNLDYSGFSNVAVSYFGEGFINFGYIGIIVFVIILAIFNAKMDNHYWTDSSEKSLFFKVSYLIMIPMLFFFLRGGLLAAYSNTFGLIFLAIVINYILKSPLPNKINCKDKK